ncbi:hypothetical protein PG989_009081 [Apiospora arundinis]
MSLEARTRPSLATGVVFWVARWRSVLATKADLLLWRSASAEEEWRLELDLGAPRAPRAPRVPAVPRDRRSPLIRSIRLSGGVLAPEEWSRPFPVFPGLSGRNFSASGVRSLEMLVLDTDRLSGASCSPSKRRTLSDTLLAWYPGDGVPFAAVRFAGPGVRGFLGSSKSDLSEGGDLDPLRTEY